MNVLVTGAKGQLGYDVVKELEKRSIDCVGVDIEDFDISDYSSTIDAIRAKAPDCIIHCAAYTAVDKAEDEQELCARINHKGTENLAKACKEMNAKMIYISTDYVLEGTGTHEIETDQEPMPLSIYGKTKLAGETAVKELLQKYFIVRISWIFGQNGNNFIKTMLKLAETKNIVNVVSDQFGSPTYTKDLAVLLCDMIGTEKYGTYHATSEGFCSWAELAQYVFDVARLKTTVNFISTEEYPTKAVRPKNSRLSKKCLDLNGFRRLPHWKDAVQSFFTEMHNTTKN